MYVVWLTGPKGLSPLAVALMMGAGDVALLALELPTGAFADRVGARASLVLGSLFQVLGMSLLWLATSAPGLALSVLSIAVGDAFRHGADEALLYRSCAALGLADRFAERVARAQAATLFALVALTAGGGWLVERAGFDAAFAVEIALSAAGLALAFALVDPAATPSAAADASGGDSPWTALRARLPWPRIVPTSLVLALASAGQFVLQSESHGRVSARTLGLLIAAAQLLEAGGAALVARGLVPAEARTLHWIAGATLATVGLAALWPPALAPALLLVFAGAGIAPAIRSALLQRDAPDHARATIASAAGALDLLITAATLSASALLLAVARRSAP
ncbi:MAG TPA: MFS transporter [Polyangia bacterium]